MKLFIKRAASMLLVAMVALGGGVLVSPATATADERMSCYGASCDDLDPANTTCADDARTIMGRDAATSVGQSAGHLELRYSPSCHANWVRFTPWYGVRSWFGHAAADAELNGSPWIWRLGVADSLRGQVGHSTIAGATTTSWTSMVTADGVTCSSVSLYQTGFSTSGGGSRDSLGAYDAPCVS